VHLRLLEDKEPFHRWTAQLHRACEDPPDNRAFGLVAVDSSRWVAGLSRLPTLAWLSSARGVDAVDAWSKTHALMLAIENAR